MSEALAIPYPYNDNFRSSQERYISTSWPSNLDLSFSLLNPNHLKNAGKLTLTFGKEALNALRTGTEIVFKGLGIFFEPYLRARKAYRERQIEELVRIYRNPEVRSPWWLRFPFL